MVIKSLKHHTGKPAAPSYRISSGSAGSPNGASKQRPDPLNPLHNHGKKKKKKNKRGGKVPPESLGQGVKVLSSVVPMQKTIKKKKSLSVGSSSAVRMSHTQDQGEKKSKKKEDKDETSVGSAHDKAPFVKIAQKVHSAGSDSTQISRQLFALMIHPISVDQFYSEYYQKKPLLVQRRNPNYYDDWVKMKHVRELVGSNELEWTYEVDVTSYKDGKRSTHNGEGEADSNEVFGMYEKKGCSVRLLRPQKRLDHMCLLLSLLEEHWGSGAGANVYLTPAGHQGFAPHWDDIEAFVLQTEGCKHWKVYAPRCHGEVMPRFSSRNFEQHEVGSPVLECDLKAGDLLYFPRGWIHQARSSPLEHSLHVTASFGYRNSWYDVLKGALEGALDEAAKHDVRIRHSAPHDYLSYMGAAHAGNNDRHKSMRREAFVKTAREMLEHMLSTLDHVPFDRSADARARDLIRERLPVELREEDVTERARGEEADRVQASTHVRLVRDGVARLLAEEKVVVLYHCVDNARTYHGKDEQALEFGPEFADAIQRLVTAYPKYTQVCALPGELDEEDKVDLVNVLVANGILTLRE